MTETNEARGQGWADGARLAFGTLSVLPAPMPSTVDRRVAGKAMILAPVVGLVLGGIAAAVVAGVHALRPGAPLLAAVLGVVVLAGLSGALHLDGLADTADGLGSRRDRETMHRIMKQSDIGPFGVVSIVAVLLIDVAALAACIQGGFGWQAILVATVASRLTLPWSCRRSVPSARPDGLGAMVASTVPTLATVITTFLTLACTAALTWYARGTAALTSYADGPADRISHTELATAYAGGPAPGAGMPAPNAGTLADLASREHTAAALLPLDARPIGVVLAVVVAIVVSLLVVRRARTAFGGITGDTLGATVELALAAALLTVALAN